MATFTAPLLLLATPALSSTGTIVFATIGRCRYAFDIFSLPLSLSPAAVASELRLTDGASVNYNDNFAPTSDSLLFVPERHSTLNLYLTPVPTAAASRREVLEVAPLSPLLPWDPIALKDSLSLTPDSSHLVYVSTALPAASPRRSWAAVYSTHLPSSRTRRLTPPDIADFSPTVSPSGEWTAAASPGPAGWTGEVEDLHTDIYVFMTSDGSRRTLAIHDGGWPSWADETTIFFHRRDSDDWYGVYRAKISVTDDGLSAASVERITPPGFHAFTPAPSSEVRLGVPEKEEKGKEEAPSPSETGDRAEKRGREPSRAEIGAATCRPSDRDPTESIWGQSLEKPLPPPDS